MTNEHILEIRKFYMGLLDKPTLKDSIFHQAHCEEMVALCNLAIARAEAATPTFHAVGWYDYGVVKWEQRLRPVNGGLLYVTEVAQAPLDPV